MNKINSAAPHPPSLPLLQRPGFRCALKITAIALGAIAAFAASLVAAVALGITGLAVIPGLIIGAGLIGVSIVYDNYKAAHPSAKERAKAEQEQVEFNQKREKEILEGDIDLFKTRTAHLPELVEKWNNEKEVDASKKDVDKFFALIEINTSVKGVMGLQFLGDKKNVIASQENHTYYEALEQLLPSIKECHDSIVEERDDKFLVVSNKDFIMKTIRLIEQYLKDYKPEAT